MQLCMRMITVQVDAKMSDLIEQCPFDLQFCGNAGDSRLESSPYKSLEEIGNFLFYLSRNELASWTSSVRFLKDSPKFRYEGNTTSLNPIWTPKVRLDRDSVPKTLFCHDFKGGYLEDRFVNGCSNHTSYPFFNWSYVDIFCYFSHHFVTVPPPSWINSAHLHGVPILGTLITEWNDGKQIWDKVLETPQRITWLADALSRIAQVYRFDGYLLNIENTLSPAQVPLLVQFIKALKQFLTQKLGPKNYIIWYDSVTVNGELKWQNELNENNLVFFDNCDGIFLNYTWSEKHLNNSVKMAGERLFDVYVGVDIWGRNFYGGGGFNTDLALQVISQRKLSCALFAFGWTYEDLPGNFYFNDLVFWKKVFKYFYIHGCGQLPFYTDFSRGYGINYYKNGEICNSSWYDLSRQSYQPTCEFIIDEQLSSELIDTLIQIKKIKIEHQKGETLKSLATRRVTSNNLYSQLRVLNDNLERSNRTLLEYYLLDGFNGGGCLKINPNIIIEPSYLSLFYFDIDITTLLEVSVTMKGSGIRCYVVFQTAGRYRKLKLTDQEVSDNLVSFGPVMTQWKTKKFVLKEFGRLLEFGIEITPSTTPILIGEVRIASI